MASDRAMSGGDEITPPTRQSGLSATAIRMQQQGGDNRRASWRSRVRLAGQSFPVRARLLTVDHLSAENSADLNFQFFGLLEKSADTFSRVNHNDWLTNPFRLEHCASGDAVVIFHQVGTQVCRRGGQRKMGSSNLPGRRTLLGCTALLAIAMAAPAQAGTVPVNFNYNGLANGADSGTIASYMDTALHSAGLGSTNVTVTNAVAQTGTSAYAGEGYVVGPNSGSTSDTLANTTFSSTGVATTTNPASDTYIKLCTTTDTTPDSGGTGCSSTSTPDFSMSFTSLPAGDYITQVSFAFEIFPDGNCASSNSCSSYPDLELYTAPGGGGVQLASWQGVYPTSGAVNPTTTVELPLCQH